MNQSAVRVLVVDDDGAARTALKELLTLHAYRVEVAVDGVAALERIVELPQTSICGTTALHQTTIIAKH